MTCILEWKCYCGAYFKREVAIFFGKVVVVISHALGKKSNFRISTAVLSVRRNWTLWYSLNGMVMHCSTAWSNIISGESFVREQFSREYIQMLMRFCSDCPLKMLHSSGFSPRTLYCILFSLCSLETDM